MEMVIFERGSAFLRKIFAEYPEGSLRVLCPACGVASAVRESRSWASRQSDFGFRAADFDRFRVKGRLCGAEIAVM
jgi:hypothetical protein